MTEAMSGPGDAANGVSVDSAGNVWLTGSTDSVGFMGIGGFPTSSPTQGSFGGSTDAFVTRLGSDGSMGFSTYLGGSGGDQGNAIAVDLNKNAIVVGNTASTNFPIVSLYAVSSIYRSSCGWQSSSSRIRQRLVE